MRIAEIIEVLDVIRQNIKTKYWEAEARGGVIGTEQEKYIKQHDALSEVIKILNREDKV
jgi:hypothetical protein